ncbi:MAG: hypothetical protein HXY52_02810 [Nitrospirae bacterium]|jgi:predicted transcriptional regulator|nr:hypothetical protein [Nitrospirota bacterium]
MKTIKIQDAIKGMILAKDVKNNYGQVLLQKGTELSEENIKSLMNRNIAKVVVEEKNDLKEFTREDIEKTKEIYRAVVEQRFINPHSDSMTEALFNAVLELTAVRVLSGGTWTKTE